MLRLRLTAEAVCMQVRMQGRTLINELPAGGNHVQDVQGATCV